MIPILGLIVGIILGIFVPYNIPKQYSNYMAVAILAALDSVFGGIAATVQDKFDMKIFLSGFLAMHCLLQVWHILVINWAYRYT